MNSRRLLVLAGALMLAASSGRAQQTAPLVDPTHLRLQPEAAEAAFGTEVQVTVFGDPAKPGLYAIRRRFKPGEMSRPHYHDKDRLVTVIKGTWYTGEGDVYDPAKTTPIKTGGFMLHPAGLHHFDGAKDQEVIVQIIGMGPVSTVSTEKK
jgi:quercetin dioxygenase-like cupin family protein